MSPKDPTETRPDLSVLRMDPEALEERRGFGWKGWLLVLVLVLIAGWMALRFFSKPAFLAPRVDTTTVRLVTPAQQSTVLTATGYTYARQRAAVGAKVVGRVLEIPVEEGDVLAKGDLIAVLDSDDLRASVAQFDAAMLEMKARLVDAEREVARQRRLVEAGITAQSELDSAETALDVVRAQLRSASARLDSAGAQLAYTRVYSPIDGVVIEKNVEVGEMVAPGGFTSQQSTGSIVRLADPSSLEIEADINESYIARVRRGQPARIEVDAVPDHVYRGHLRQIVPTADRQRAVVEVKVAIDDRDERLVPDMSCTVTFLEEGVDTDQLDTEPVLYVDSRAIIDDDGRSAVLLVEDGKLRRQKVTLGAIEGDEQVITEGLSGGEVLALPTADEPLSDGMQVRIAK